MTYKEPVDIEKRKKIYKKLGLKTKWVKKSGAKIVFQTKRS